MGVTEVIPYLVLLLPQEAVAVLALVQREAVAALVVAVWVGQPTPQVLALLVKVFLAAAVSM